MLSIKSRFSLSPFSSFQPQIAAPNAVRLCLFVFLNSPYFRAQLLPCMKRQPDGSKMYCPGTHDSLGSSHHGMEKPRVNSGGWIGLKYFTLRVPNPFLNSGQTFKVQSHRNNSLKRTYQYISLLRDYVPYLWTTPRNQLLSTVLESFMTKLPIILNEVKTCPPVPIQ